MDFIKFIILFTINTSRLSIQQKVGIIAESFSWNFFVVVSALGIFGNNFDPNIGDSVKFSITLHFVVAFPISFCLLLEFIKKGTKTFIILLILFLFIWDSLFVWPDTQIQYLQKLNSYNL